MAIKDGKYLMEDVAEYMLWFCEEILGSPINNYQLNYILVYAVAEYRKIYNVNFLWNVDIECWTYGFMFPELYHSFTYNDSYEPFAPICGIKYPNEETRDFLGESDKVFLNYIIKSLINKSLEEFRAEMQSMKLHKKRYVKGFRNEVFEDELAEEFKAHDWINKKI